MNKSYLETKRIKQGLDKMNPDFKPLSKFIEQHFGSAPLNIIHDFLDGKTPRLEIVMEFWKDSTTLNSPEQSYFKAMILERFNELVPRKTVKKTIGNFFSLLKKSKNKYQTDGMFVFFSSFELEALKEVGEAVPKTLWVEFTASLEQPEIWQIFKMSWSLVVMFYTDEQANKFEQQGLKTEILKKYASLIMPFDEFGYLQNEMDDLLKFDSKDNFDQNYESNWQYYFS